MKFGWNWREHYRKSIVRNTNFGCNYTWVKLEIFQIDWEKIEKKMKKLEEDI
jgi:hypothetical protein